MKKTIKKLSTMLLSFAMVVNLSPASKLALFANETETDTPAATESAETTAPKETEKPAAKETAKPSEEPSEETAKPAEKDEEPAAETTKETPKPEAETSKETEAAKETDETDEPEAEDPDETEIPEEPEESDADIPDETDEPKADKTPVESDKPEADEPEADAGSKRAPDESDSEDAKNWEYPDIPNVKISKGILTWEPNATATSYELIVDPYMYYAFCYIDAPANSFNINKQIDIWIKSSQIKKPKNNTYKYQLWEYRNGETALHEGSHFYKSSAKPYKIGKISSVKYSSGKLSWKKFSGAAKYGFSIDEEFKGEFSTTAASFNIKTTIDKLIKDRRMYKRDSYKISIYAYDKDGIYMAYWNGTIKYLSNTVPCEVASINASITDDTLSWDSVPNTDYYNLRVVGTDYNWAFAEWGEGFNSSQRTCNLKEVIASLIDSGYFKEFSTYTLELTANNYLSDLPLAEWTGSYKYKEPNTLNVSSKTAKVKYNKKKNATLKRPSAIKITDKGQGDITYKKVSGNSKFTINSTTGNITIKKKLKKKTYTIKVKVIASGDETYARLEKILTIKIKLK